MDRAEATERLLDSAERLFYTRGVRAVGMDEIRSDSGVSLKRLYQCFPSKEELVLAYLRRRDERWRASLAAAVTEQASGARDRVLAVFDWLHEWFSQPDFRGCAFLNSAGELGPTSPAVVQAARQHKHAVRSYLATLAADVPVPDPQETATQLHLLVEGAIASAAVTGTPEPARHARHAAEAALARS